MVVHFPHSDYFRHSCIQKSLPYSQHMTTLEEAAVVAFSSRSTSPALSVLDDDDEFQGIEEIPAAPTTGKVKSTKSDGEGAGVVYVGYISFPPTDTPLSISSSDRRCAR